MINKATYAVILLLACLLMVAQSGAPHHHHGQLACFNWHHCRNESGGNESEEHNHTHNEKSHSGCNLPDRAAIIIQNSVHSAIRLISKSDRIDLSHDFQYSVTSLESVFFSNDCFIKYRRQPFNYSFNVRFVSGTSGLRAPPMV